MRVKRIFIDTNILLYLTDSSSPWRDAAIKSLQKARSLEFELIISQQILREYLTTNSQLNENNIVPQKVIDSVRTFHVEFTVVGDKREVLTTLLDLLQEVPMKRKQIRHANIVATMLVYDVEHLLTHHVEDFECFAEKIHILPLEEWGRNLGGYDQTEAHE